MENRAPKRETLVAILWTDSRSICVYISPSKEHNEMENRAPKRETLVAILCTDSRSICVCISPILKAIVLMYAPCSK